MLTVICNKRLKTICYMLLMPKMLEVQFCLLSIPANIEVAMKEPIHITINNLSKTMKSCTVVLSSLRSNRKVLELVKPGSTTNQEVRLSSKHQSLWKPTVLFKRRIQWTIIQMFYNSPLTELVLLCIRRLRSKRYNLFKRKGLMSLFNSKELSNPQ